MTHDRDTPSPRPSLFSISLACRRCGKSDDQTVAGVFDFLATAWPQCCGEDMALRLNLRWPENPPGDAVVTLA